jgi:hypothetical protein
MIIDGLDQHCRYLSAPSCSLRYHFGSFLKKLDVWISEDQLRELVRLGWIQPALRVRLPDRLFLSWDNYPTLSFSGNIVEEDYWAVRLWTNSATNPSLARINSSEKTRNWYTHYLDDPSSDLGQVAHAHAIPTGPGAEEPPALQHPRGNSAIYPWIDFYAYWQAYEIAETLSSLHLFGPLSNWSNVERVLEQIRQRLPEEREFYELRRQATQRRWWEYRPTFEWISRFRTLLGAWAQGPQRWEEVTHAAPRLLADLQLTPEDLRHQIRDVLLVQWERWNPRSQKDDTPKGIRAHLQQDIQRAVEFLAEATGKNVDYDDPFWGIPEDGMSREWAPLPEALPYESLEAKREFAFQATIYLDDVNALFEERPFEEAKIRDLISTWWPKSVALRRFCLAFQRLHDHLASQKGDKIGLRAQTPVEFLLLCVLHAEKILRDRHLEGKTGTIKLPGVTRLILIEAEQILLARGFHGCNEGLLELETLLNTKGQLHYLHLNPRSPFVEAVDVSWGGDLEKHVIASFANLGILRNYAAHHDCLDEELSYTPLGGTVVQALLLTTLLVLSR